jgi:hypothetical protein
MVVASPVILFRPTVAADFAHPTSRRALERLLEKKVERRLLKYGALITGSEARAKDLLQQARMVVCEPDREKGGRPWDPARGSLIAHMRIVIREIAQKGWRSAQARREVLDEEIAEAPESGSQPRPDEAVDRSREAEVHRELGRILRGRLEGLPLAVFDRLCVDDEESCADMAQALSCSVKEVYDANRVIAYHAARVKADYEQTEERRLKEARSRATKRM